MKSKNILFLAIVIFFTLVVVYGFLRYRNIKLLEQGFNSTGSATTTQQVRWNTYTNTKYGYTLLFPKGSLLGLVQEAEGVPVEESMMIEIGMPGGVPPVGVQITVWEPYTYQTTDKIALEHNRIARLDLKSFSETLRQKFVDDKNPNFPNKKIGDLEETTFAGHKAYAATVTGYTDSRSSDTFRYIYVENGTYKLVVQYSLKGDLSKQIVDTFKFIE